MWSLSPYLQPLWSSLYFLYSSLGGLLAALYPRPERKPDTELSRQLKAGQETVSPT